MCVCVCVYLSEELRHDFDLLSAGEQVGERDPGDSGHLHVVDDTHELLQQAQRQVGVLQTVHRQPAPRLLIPILQREKERGRERETQSCGAEDRVATAWIVEGIRANRTGGGASA